MYGAFLLLHSWLRWAVLLAGVVVLWRGVRGASGPGRATGGLRKAALAFVITLDLQLLVGVALYSFLSPTTTHAFSNFAVAMQARLPRFWLVEHPSLMLLAVVLAHLGNVVLKRAQSQAKRRRAVALFGAAMVAVLLGIPWPMLAVGRPLFRL